MTRFYWDDEDDWAEDDDFPPEEQDEDNPDPYREWDEPEDQSYGPEDEWEEFDESELEESALDVYLQARSQPEPPPETTSTPGQAADLAESARKAARSLKERMAVGHEFEYWVARRFNKRWFEIVDWRSDKEVDGRLPRSSSYPDFVFALHHDGEETHFAVECKWRERPWKSTFSWDRQAEQLNIYRKFSARFKIPVFLVLGLGGTAENPAEVFIVPVERAGDQPLRLDMLKRDFARKQPSKPFFFDRALSTLK